MNRPIKLAFDYQVFSFQEYGGVSKYFYELAKRISANPKFISSIVAPLYVNRYLAAGETAVRGIRVPPLAYTGPLRRVLNHSISSAFYRLATPDVVHETYYPAMSCVPNASRIVTTIHDMIYEKFPSSFLANDKTSARKRAAVNRADHVICVSENTRKDLIELFAVDPKKVTTIHHGVALAETSRKSTQFNVRKPFFLYVGQRSGYKNFANLLVAYGSSASVNKSFDLIAFGVDPFDAKEHDAIRASGLDASRVRHLTGDDSLLDHLYRNATALFYPSLYEGFGFPPLEAMLRGCPVACSNTSSIPEVVGDAGLYFDPTEIDAIRQALETFASSVGARSKFVELGLLRVRHFSFDKCAEQTIRVYESALQK